MKKTLFLLTCICIILSSCEKDSDPAEPTFSVVGLWNLTSVCGGVMNECSFPDADFVKILEITDSGIIVRENDTITFSSNYTVSSKINQDTYTRYELETDNGDSMIVTSYGNQLSIEKGSLIETYEKK